MSPGFLMNQEWKLQVISKMYDELTPNMQAYLDLVNDINHTFIGLEYDEPCDICDGDMKLLDKAVTKFKKTVWFNQNGIL